MLFVSRNIALIPDPGFGYNYFSVFYFWVVICRSEHYFHSRPEQHLRFFVAVLTANSMLVLQFSSLIVRVNGGNF